MASARWANDRATPNANPDAAPVIGAASRGLAMARVRFHFNCQRWQNECVDCRHVVYQALTIRRSALFGCA
jgi:hypothetical protein